MPTPSANKLTLYDVALEGMQLEDLLIAAEGELTPEIEERLDRAREVANINSRDDRSA